MNRIYNSVQKAALKASLSILNVRTEAHGTANCYSFSKKDLPDSKF